MNVRETEYPFSLNAAKFNSLDTPPAGPSNPVVHYDHDPAPDKLSLWPGSRAFAEAFGRLQLGQLSLIEIDPGVPTTALRFVLIPIVESALQHGGRVFMAVPPAVSVEEIWEAMRNHMPLTRFLENVRIYPIGRTVVTHSELQRTLIELPRPRPGGGGSELESSFKFLTEPGAKGGLNAALAWHAGLRLLAASAGFEYTPDTAPQLVRQFLFSGETHLMVLGHNHDPTFRALSDMASLHIQMRERCGRVFVTGEKPRAPNFLLFPGNDQDPYQLVPLV